MLLHRRNAPFIVPHLFLQGEVSSSRYLHASFQRMLALIYLLSLCVWLVVPVSLADFTWKAIRLVNFTVRMHIETYDYISGNSAVVYNRQDL